MQPLDIDNVAALQAMTEANLRSAREAAEAAERAHQTAEQLRLQMAQRAGGQS
ncbi:hypothetical protein AB0D10_42510 [Kitasatospora sp. NPDC048545]|uniref:hypothetical protein n=1 Tax=Kitasatospora sp. NPDC048545 TaxID=3157208 RepID=UPI0033E79975